MATQVIAEEYMAEATPAVVTAPDVDKGSPGAISRRQALIRELSCRQGAEMDLVSLLTFQLDRPLVAVDRGMVGCIQWPADTCHSGARIETSLKTDVWLTCNRSCRNTTASATRWVSRWHFDRQSLYLTSSWSELTPSPRSPSLTVSMLFVGQAAGFLAASLANSLLTERFGLGKIIALGGIIQTLGYIFIIPGWPFPIMPVCYAVVGFGMALQDAQANTYVAILPNADYKFGLLHASYGLGALVCPLAATAFASSGIQFSFFYSISLGLSLINVAILLNAFRFKYRIPMVESTAAATDAEANSSGDEMELQELGEGGEEKDTASSTNGNSQSNGISKARASPARAIKKRKNSLHATLTNRTVLVMAVFIFVYVGSEVSMGGWIVTFLQQNRGGGPRSVMGGRTTRSSYALTWKAFNSAGYVASGFWAGLTVSRAISPPLNAWVGEQRIIYIYLALAICLEIAIWFGKNFIGNAVTGEQSLRMLSHDHVLGS